MNGLDSRSYEQINIGSNVMKIKKVVQNSNLITIASDTQIMTLDYRSMRIVRNHCSLSCGIKTF